jgi:hypothetical protein
VGVGVVRSNEAATIRPESLWVKALRSVRQGYSSNARESSHGDPGGSGRWCDARHRPRRGGGPGRSVREARGRRGARSAPARGMAVSLAAPPDHRPGGDPFDRDPDGDQPRRSQVHPTGACRARCGGRVDDRADARVAGDPRTDGRRGRPAGRPAAAARLLPLRRWPPSVEPRARGLPDPSRGILGRGRVVRSRGLALGTPRRRLRPRRSWPDRGVRRLGVAACDAASRSRFRSRARGR